MHATAMSHAKFFLDAYVQNIPTVCVVEIGVLPSLSPSFVSLKDLCPPNAEYVGVGMEEAEGIDIVLPDAHTLPFQDNSLDVVVSSSFFQHSEMFWLLFSEVMRVLKPSGLLYINALSNGPFKRQPVDCWRFYPDSGNALVRWAQRGGYNAALLESFVTYPSPEGGKDFVAVFIKDERFADQYPVRILHHIQDYTNGIVYGEEEYRNFNNQA